MSKQGHSGFSASYLIQLFAKLASFEPLTRYRLIGRMVE